MLAPVLQHIQERVPYLPRRGERPRVVAITPDSTLAPEEAVDRPGDPDREPLNTAREPRRPVGLHQQVEMIGLDAVVEEAEAVAGGGGERAPHGREKWLVAQGRESCTCAQSDVSGMSWLVGRAALVRNGAATGSGLAPGTWTPTTPGPDRKLELLRAARRHLDTAVIIGR
jgi:hypothetical protein